MYSYVVTCCSITSSAERQLAVNELNVSDPINITLGGPVNESLGAHPMDINVGGPVNSSVSVSGAAVNRGSLRDLLNNVNIPAPLMCPLDPTDSVTDNSVTAVSASPPSYEMAVADSNRRTQQRLHQQQLVMTSQQLVMTSQQLVMTSQAPVVMTSQPTVMTSQQLVMTSQPVMMTSQAPVLMTDSCAKTTLLSGGNTIMVVPQV